MRQCVKSLGLFLVGLLAVSTVGWVSDPLKEGRAPFKSMISLGIDDRDINEEDAQELKKTFLAEVKKNEVVLENMLSFLEKSRERYFDDMNYLYSNVTSFVRILTNYFNNRERSFEKLYFLCAVNIKSDKKPGEYGTVFKVGEEIRCYSYFNFEDLNFFTCQDNLCSKYNLISETERLLDELKNQSYFDAINAIHKIIDGQHEKNIKKLKNLCDQKALKGVDKKLDDKIKLMRELCEYNKKEFGAFYLLKNIHSDFLELFKQSARVKSIFIVKGYQW